MNVLAAAWLVVAGCAAPERPALPPRPAFVEDAKVESGEALVVHATEGTTLSIVPEGAVPTPQTTEIWEIRAKDGSYVVTATDAAGGVTKLYVDVGVSGPTGGPMDGLAALPPPPPSRWAYYLTALVFGLLGFAVARFVRGKLKKPAPPPIPDPPHVIAIRAWGVLRERHDLDDEALARLMSEVFRNFLDATQPFPATKRTTKEIVDNLASTLTAAELQAARRLLMATDMVKFATRAERANLFEQLDGDFSLLVSARRG
jgi:hypothetical protein